MPFVRRVTSLLLLAALGACGGSRTDGAPSSSSSSGTVPPGPTGTGTTDPPPASCSPTAAADIEVSNRDLNAYPPYAIDGCTLVYVDASGALLARDLRDGKEITVAPAAEQPRRPALSPEVIAWEATVSGRDVVRALRTGATAPSTVEGFMAAREPRVSGPHVVFTAWSGVEETSDTDVWVLDTTSGKSTLVLGGPGQQRFADISSAFVAITDFSEDIDGTSNRNKDDVADIVLVDRSNGAITRRIQTGKQAFPLLVSSDRLAYMHWGDIHPEPKFTLYQLKSGGLRADVASDIVIADVKNMSSEEVRFSGSSGMLEWVANPDGKTSLLRAPADGSQPAVRTPGLDDLVLFAPVSIPGVTVVAAMPAMSTGTRTPRLRSLAR